MEAVGSSPGPFIVRGTHVLAVSLRGFFCTHLTLLTVQRHIRLIGNANEVSVSMLVYLSGALAMKWQLKHTVGLNVKLGQSCWSTLMLIEKKKKNLPYLISISN